MAVGRIRLPLARNELKRLVEERRKEVEALLASRNYSGAYYLSGYIIELALKVCIAKNMRRNVIPARQFIDSIYTHDLDKLIGVADLRDNLTQEGRLSDDFTANWKEVSLWNEESRYRRWTRSDAMSLYRAITDEDHGVLRWIMQYW
jgi:hypothetical protein